MYSVVAVCSLLMLMDARAHCVHTLEISESFFLSHNTSTKKHINHVQDITARCYPGICVQDSPVQQPKSKRNTHKVIWVDWSGSISVCTKHKSRVGFFFFVFAISDNNDRILCSGRGWKKIANENCMNALRATTTSRLTTRYQLFSVENEKQNERNEWNTTNN